MSHKKNKIKILFVNGGPLDYGGITTWLLNYLSAIDKEFFDISILVHGGIGAREKHFTELGIKIYHIPFKKDCLLRYTSLINKVLDNNFDIVHSHMDAANSIILKLAKNKGVKIRISHVHSSNFLNNNLLRMPFNIHNKNMLLKYSTILLACSLEAGNFYYGEGKKFILFPNAIKPEIFKFSEVERKKLREKIGLNERDIVIGQIGHICDNKNQIFSIDCLEPIIKKDKRVKYVAIGDGDLSAIIEYTKKLGIKNNSFFLGPKNDINHFYNIFDILLQPSKSEGVPLTLIEAQYNGLTVLASNRIPMAAKISERYYSIELIEKEWTIIIEKLMNSKRNENSIISNEYDINNSVQLLEKIYLRSFSDCKVRNAKITEE